jgi:type II secretory pathway component PulF
MNFDNVDFESINRSFLQLQLRTNKRERFRIYRKMEGMLRMNESLSRCLDRLYQNTSDMGKYPHRPAAVALKEWFLRDREGVNLSQAMVGWAPSSEVYMVRAGEESGTLAKALSAIQGMGENAKKMRAAVTYAISYPAFMMILVSFVLWMFGVNLIQNMRATAPPQVMAEMAGVAAVSDFIMNWGIVVVVLILASAIAIAVTLPYWRGPLRNKLDKFAPWSWYRVLQGSGFLLGLSSLLGAQVPLKRALEILEEQGTPWLRERIYAARQEVLRGRNLGDALIVTGYDFPDRAVAADLAILSERADVGTIIEQVTDEWVEEQIESLQRQAAISRNVGMAIVGVTIGWAMSSIFGVVQAVASGGGLGGH